ncbi:response regulator [Methanolobus bombayensis]|uniref:response regulator n=1 Tax=Methanolobus bombayensis TaxID=38023 RepID=UPI001AEA2D30|nr:response regulator [Methanolobus bombayensis]MBP1908652.1 PAS domain S-box-containing protein [Methanolobus bombayensis]
MKVNVIKIFSFALMILFIFSGTIGAEALNDNDTLVIGVLVGDTRQASFERLNGTDDYLSSQISEFTFEMVPMDFGSIQEGLSSGNIDYLIVDPATFVILENSNGVSSIATMETVAYLPPDYVQYQSTYYLGSVVFTEKDREDIANMADTIGLSFLVMDTPSNEGWWVAKREFIEHRIVPESDFASLEFNNNPENIAHSIENGDFDVGVLPSGILEKMHMEGKINISDFKVVHPQEYDNYPFLVSTRIYPGWVFAKAPDTSKSISERVSVSLLNMPFGVTDTSSIKDVAGWTVSQDYNSVIECLMEIKEGPFQEQIDLMDLLERMKYFLLAILFLLIIATASVFYVNNLNSKLEKEIFSKNEAEKLLKRKHSIEKTMLNVSSMFAYPGDVDLAIDMSLMEIGTLCGASRSYLFFISEDGASMSNTHEWCSEGVETQKDELQELPSDMFPWWMSKLKNDEIINITDTSSLPPEASAEKEILEMQDIRSVLVLPVFTEGNLIGFVGLDEVEGTRAWNSDDFDTLHMFSTLMAIVLKRRKMEKSLLESEQHLKRVLEGSNEGTWDVNLQDDYLIFNKRYADIIGYHEEEIGRNFEWMQRRIHPNDVDCAVSAIDDVLNKTINVAECEYRIRGKDGKYRWVSNKGKVVEYSEAGEPLHIAGVLVDISERKEAEAALLAAKTTAEEASRTKSEFLANMSHELRTPLNSVIGFADILAEGTFGSLNNKQQRYVNNISKSGKHLLSLINDILDLSKIEAGKMTLHPEKFEIGDSLDEIRSIISPLARKKDIKLIIDMDPDRITINADKGKFKQIIYNLLSNAIKFTGIDGCITVSVRLQEDCVRVEVKDTGIGISKEDQEKLFKSFTQIDSSSCRVYEGTGLGLVLVKNFVGQHYGKIWVESELGSGSSFIFEMPVDFTRISQSDMSDSNSESTGDFDESSGCSFIPDIEKSDDSTDDRPLVLVIEDDTKSQEILSFTLQEAGYNVRFAENGNEALELAKELHPFAITLDIMIPEMDGWDVLKTLKKDEGTEDIPVVIISIIDEKKLGIIWGAFDYFVKPVDREELLSSLERLRKYCSCEKVNVLVIDDEPSVLELMDSVLSTEGYNVITVSSGKEGIDKALKCSPDVIVLDLMMPVVDGFDVIRELKKHPETIDIPIIICTAKDLEVHEKEELDKNVSFVMQKGIFNKQDLLACIKKVENLSTEKE